LIEQVDRRAGKLSLPHVICN